jgi:antitoxin VapB
MCEHGTMNAHASLFKLNQSQAVRLPKALAFPDTVTEVLIRRVGNQVIITPANAVWTDFFQMPSVDLGEREQPSPDKREDF